MSHLEDSTSSENENAKPVESTAVVTSSSEIDDLTTIHERVIASLSYIGFLAIIPFYLNKESKFCRFHGKQGLILAIIFFFASPLMVLDIVTDIVLLAQVGIFIYMGLAALSGKWKKLPWIYEQACKLEKTLSVKFNEQKSNRPDDDTQVDGQDL